VQRLQHEDHCPAGSHQAGMSAACWRCSTTGWLTLGGLETAVTPNRLAESLQPTFFLLLSAGQVVQQVRREVLDFCDQP
jgi:hypothetical protein